MRLVRRDPDTAYLDNWLWVPKKFTNLEGVRNALSFQFADSFSENKVRFVYLWKESDHHILVPRHFWPIESLPYRVVDLRPQHYAETGITSRIKLDHRVRDGILVPDGNDVQQRSMDALLSSGDGLLQLACGKGKTVVALEEVTRRQVPALIVLPDTQLLEQWTRDIEALLDVPGGVGLLQGAKNDWKKFLVLTTYHTIGARAENLTDEMRRWFGIVIWDEGHHIPAPTFAASAEAFYGIRRSLTATPDRDDGLHIISQYHIGPVLYKDLTPVQKPRIFFRWTGLEIDETRPDADVRDRNGEIHGSKVASYNAKWPERRTAILNDAVYAIGCGRKVLVLSGSEAEIANMAAMWHGQDIGYQPNVPLYTDIPTPVPQDVNETVMPEELEDTRLKYTIRDIHKMRRKLCKLNLWQSFDQLTKKWMEASKELDDAVANKRKKGLKILEKAHDAADQALSEFCLSHLPGCRFHDPRVEGMFAELYRNEMALRQHFVHKKLVAELERRQKIYITHLHKQLTNCGMMVYKVPAKERKRFIDTMPIVFAITKYGKEGLNSEELDTILVSSIFSSRNGLQQLNGRNTRDFVGKKSPVTVFYEDNIGHIIGMCKKLKKHLREWPVDEGGPYEFEQIGHPHTVHRSGTWEQNLDRIFGR